MVTGLAFTIWNWAASINTGIPHASGTLVIASTTLIIATQCLLAFLSFDVSSYPRRPSLRACINTPKPNAPSLAALLCVCGIAAGQLLFKCAADSQSMSGSYLHPRTLLWLLSALLLYGTTFGWLDLAAGTPVAPLSLDGTRLRDRATAEFSTAGGEA